MERQSARSPELKQGLEQRAQRLFGNRFEESFTVRRVARRVAHAGRSSVLDQPPAKPVGVKLELTWRCNLRCGFCYTDSPRHTLARTLDLPDEAWIAIADQVLELGVLETVITGGEPLLRKELALELAARLGGAGVGITFNTNGWFVDRDVAAALARVPAGLQVYVSIDGATPELHDASRGVPGSWRRAIQAVHVLLEHGVSVGVVHVVTPENRDTVMEFLEQMWLLGAPDVRLTPVVRIGAAAREERWGVDRRALRRTVERFREAWGRGMRVVVQAGTAAAIAGHDDVAPKALLVRPGGEVLTDSLHPFSYGHALDDGLAECWRGVAGQWRNPTVSGWADSISGSRDLPNAPIVPYLDGELRSDGRPTAVPGGRSAPVPAPARGRHQEPHNSLAQARAVVTEQVLKRRFRIGPVRSADEGATRVVRHLETRAVIRLNRSGASAMDALAGGSAQAAVERLAAEHPDVPRERLVHDVAAIARTLAGHGVIVPAAAP